MNSAIKKLLTGGLALSVPMLLSSPMAMADVVGGRASGEGAESRMVIEVDRPSTHSVFTLDSPPRVVIDIPDSKIRTRNIETLSTDLIKRVRTGVRNGNDARLVLDVTSTPKVKSTVIPRSGYTHERIVIDLTSKGGRAVAPVTTNNIENGDRDIVIVIDPGHGGKDPGATGPSGTREKHVVLRLSKILAQKINAMDGYRAVLTREDDRYLKLRLRTAIARQHGADLMLSVHADAFKDARPKGASVFALSQSGASSETARWLANSENKADLIGGSGSLSLDDKDQQLASVLLDLSMTSTINTSVTIGSEVLGRIGKVTDLHKHSVEQAGFVVLKSPDIPSLLIEAGFISNPTEERNLQSSHHLNRLADSITRGIEEYFRKAPPPGTRVASRSSTGPARYTVKAGDTLSGLSSRYGVAVERLRKENDLKGDGLWIGQAIRIPSS